MKKIICIYKNNIEKYKKKKIAIKQKRNFAALIRLVLFIAIIIIPFVLLERHIGLLIISEIIFVIPFAVTVKWSIRLKYHMKFITELIDINEKEISSILNGSYDGVSGKEFINTNHCFSYDLDIFGENSIFQYINRTCTKIGKAQLANLLQTPLLSKEEIIKNQDAIKELSRKTNWRQNFQALGNLTSEERRETNISDWFELGNTLSEKQKIPFKTEEDNRQIKKWLVDLPYFLNKKILYILLFVFPIITSGLLILFIISDLPFKYFFLAFLGQLALTGMYLRKINNIHSNVNRQADIINKYQGLLMYIENERFDSEKLKDMQNCLVKDKKLASKCLKELKVISKMLDNRLNMLFGFLSNGLVLWDLHFCFRLEKWKIKHKDDFSKWFSVIAGFDSLSGFGAFAFNNQSYCFPEISKDKNVFNIINGGHILIHKDKRINNNFSLIAGERISIITGANMAGKSTFLRMIGVNMILAMCGAPVCAEKFEFSPIKLFTSVRMNDSLQDNESYFYAELKRLKEIIKQIEKGDNLFVIVDEMLKGTNSKDKHTGSKKFIEKLIKTDTPALIATHDLGLSELEKQYPEKVKNYCFEVEIIENQLKFDYKLIAGVSQNLNATFLMKRHGIID